MIVASAALCHLFAPLTAALGRPGSFALTVVPVAPIVVPVSPRDSFDPVTVVLGRPGSSAFAGSVVPPQVFRKLRREPLYSFQSSALALVQPAVVLHQLLPVSATQNLYLDVDIFRPYRVRSCYGQKSYQGDWR